MSAEVKERTWQEDLVLSLQSATDYAKRLRTLPKRGLVLKDDDLCATVNARLLEMRMRIGKAIDEYNALAWSTGAVMGSEQWYLAQVK